MVKRARGMRRLLGVSLCVAALGAISLASASAPASASFTNFCSPVSLSPPGGGSSGCHEPTFRKTTRVNVVAQLSGCASALNGNGVITGGLVCTPSWGGEASNGNYTGTQFLQALITNNDTVWQTESGSQFYNP